MFFRNSNIVKNGLIGMGVVVSVGYASYNAYRIKRIQDESRFFDVVRNGDDKEFLSLVEKYPHFIYMRDKKDERQAIHIAALGNYAPPKGAIGKYKSIVDDILKRDKRVVNNVDINGCTPLHLAAQAADEDITKALLDEGANTKANQTTHKGQPLGWLPIHLAVCPRMVNEEKVIKVLDLLIKHSPDSVNARCVDGRTPLYVAINSGLIDAAKKLIKHGADINIPTYTVDEAEAKGCEQKLEEAKLTPLHKAIVDYVRAKKSAQKVIGFLIESSADQSAIDARGKTPLDYADKEIKLEIERLHLQSQNLGTVKAFAHPPLYSSSSSSLFGESTTSLTPSSSGSSAAPTQQMR